MKLKKWFRNVLIIISFISLVLLGSDCNDIKTFILVHLGSASVFVLANLLLIKYER